MAPLNPYSVMNSFDGTMYGGGIGAKRPMRQFPTLPSKNPQTNPYSFTGQDQYGTLQGGGDMSGIAPNANQMAIRSANNVGVQNPTQNVANNPYASMFPTFNANDLTFTPDRMSIGEGSNERISTSPGMGSLANVGNYFAGQTSLNPNNYMFRQVTSPDGMGIDPNMMELMIKTGAKEGTVTPYMLQNGQWTPNTSAMRTQNWDTGNSFQNRALAMIAGGALASPYITQALGAGAAGATGAGGMGSAGGLSGIDALIAAGEGMVPVASSATPAALGSAGSAALGSGIGLGGAGGLSDLLSGLGGRAGNLGSSVGRLLGGAGGGGVRGGAGSGGGGLAGLIAALYGSNAQENYADQLKQFIQEMRSNANPYMTRLQESYTNPQAYLESPEMQARLGIEANKLTGIDASKGRLSNDIQRTKLLQDYGMGALNEYRTGLRNTVQNLWNPNQVFQAQALMGAADAAKYSDLARLLGQGTQGGFSVGNTVNDIKSIIDAGGDLWDFIKDWF